MSYYDYYQPEAYVPSTDTYIEKDALINDTIDMMRHAATRALLSRKDVIIVASVSCIYGIGDRGAYQDMLVTLEAGQTYLRDKLLRHLVDIQYQRNDWDFHRGTFRVRGDVVEVFPAYEEDRAIRMELWGDEVESIAVIDPLRGTVMGKLLSVAIFPEQPLRDAGGAAQARRSRASRRSSARGSPSCGRRASCSRRSACVCARSTTSRTCVRWGSATASRTTRGT